MMINFQNPFTDRLSISNELVVIVKDPTTP